MKPPPEEKLVNFIKYCEIDMEYFRKDLHEWLSIVDYESSLKAAVTAYDHVLKQLLNKHAPEQENVVTIRYHEKLMTGEVKFQNS